VRLTHIVIDYLLTYWLSEGVRGHPANRMDLQLCILVYSGACARHWSILESGEEFPVCGRAGADGAVLGAGAERRLAVAADEATPHGRQHAPERVAKLPVEDAVDDRVHRAVDVAEPREHGKDERPQRRCGRRRSGTTTGMTPPVHYGTVNHGPPADLPGCCRQDLECTA